MKYSSAAPVSYRNSKVTIVGAGKVGSTLTQRIAEKNLADVVLLDTVEGLPQGIALDLRQARGIESHDSKIVGTNDYADTANSDIVIIAAGQPRNPGMSREDLLQINAKIVVDVAKKAVARSQIAIFIVITNPLDVMTYLVWLATKLPPQKVVGMAGVLDSSRLQNFIAEELGIPPQDVTAMVLGSHGDLMLPLPRYCTVGGVPITELIESEAIASLVKRTRHGGGEIVKLLQTGGAYFAPASSTCLMVESILRDRKSLLPAAAYLRGEYGLNDIFLGVPCRLGSRGVESILQFQLSREERQSLQASAELVKQNLKLALASVEI